MKQKMDPHLDRLRQRLQGTNSLVKAAFLIGSHATRRSTSESDTDLLIITEKQISVAEAASLGDTILGCEDVGSEAAFSFHHPICERCRLVPGAVRRFHVIVHPYSEFKRWIADREFIVCMWTQSYRVLMGEDLFGGAIAPILNKSLLDRWDGVPSFITQIRLVLLTKHSDRDAHEYARYCKFYRDRAIEFKRWLPEIAGRYENSPNKSDRTELAELGGYFEKLYAAIEIALADKVGG